MRCRVWRAKQVLPTLVSCGVKNTVPWEPLRSVGHVADSRCLDRISRDAQPPLRPDETYTHYDVDGYRVEIRANQLGLSQLGSTSDEIASETAWNAHETLSFARIVPCDCAAVARVQGGCPPSGAQRRH